MWLHQGYQANVIHYAVASDRYWSCWCQPCHWEHGQQHSTNTLCNLSVITIGVAASIVLQWSIQLHTNEGSLPTTREKNRRENCLNVCSPSKWLSKQRWFTQSTKQERDICDVDGMSGSESVNASTPSAAW